MVVKEHERDRTCGGDGRVERHRTGLRRAARQGRRADLPDRAQGGRRPCPDGGLRPSGRARACRCHGFREPGPGRRRDRRPSCGEPTWRPGEQRRRRPAGACDGPASRRDRAGDRHQPGRRHARGAGLRPLAWRRPGRAWPQGPDHQHHLGVGQVRLSLHRRLRRVQARPGGLFREPAPGTHADGRRRDRRRARRGEDADLGQGRRRRPVALRGYGLGRPARPAGGKPRGDG